MTLFRLMRCLFQNFQEMGQRLGRKKRKQEQNQEDQALPETDFSWNKQLQLLQSSSYLRDRFKQCPRCRILMEKTQGCSHVSCVQCHLEFNWGNVEYIGTSRFV